MAADCVADNAFTDLSVALFTHGLFFQSQQTWLALGHCGQIVANGAFMCGNALTRSPP